MKHKTRRFLTPATVLVAIALVLLLASCSQAPAAEQPAAEPTATEAAMEAATAAPTEAAMEEPTEAPTEAAMEEPTEAMTATVEISDFQFLPAELEVPVGTTVTWMNMDATQHSATSLDGVWDTDLLNQGENGSFTFSEPGEYHYQCKRHNSMVGIIKVVEQ